MSTFHQVQAPFRWECELCPNAAVKSGPFYTRRLFRNHIIFYHNYDIDRRRDEFGQWQDYLEPIYNERLEQQQRRIFLKSALKQTRHQVYQQLQEKARLQHSSTMGAEGSGDDIKSSVETIHRGQPETATRQPRTYRQSAEMKTWWESEEELQHKKAKQNNRTSYTPAGYESDSSSQEDTVSMKSSEYWSDLEQDQRENSNWFSGFSELSETGRSTAVANAPPTLSRSEPGNSTVAKEGGGPEETVTNQATQSGETVARQADLRNRDNVDNAADYSMNTGAEINLTDYNAVRRQQEDNDNKKTMESTQESAGQPEKTTQDKDTSCSNNIQQTELINPENAAIVHLIAEAMTFKDENVNDLTDRIKLSNNVFDRNEIKRLLKAIAMTSRVIANQLAGTLGTAAVVDPSGKLGQAMIMQELSVLRNRVID